MYYDELPDAIKQRVLGYLKADDFPAAKEVYDEWMKKQKNIDWSSASSETL